jgi:DNA-binding transcriptional MocR family regulator
MFLKLDKSKREPLYKQIAQEISDKILAGEFESEKPLPSVRTLSLNLGVSHMTIVKAYEKLEQDNMVVKHHGKGIFINSKIVHPNSDNKIVSSWYNSIEDYHPRALTLSLLKNTLIKKPYNMSYSMLSPDLCLDFEPIFCKLVGRFQDIIMPYGPTTGDMDLKISFSKYLSKYRFVNTTPDDLLIISGSQQGLNLIAQVFTGPRDLVMIESPSYTGAIDAFKGSGAVIKPLNISNNCFPFNELIRQCDKEPPKFIYLTPNYSNPIGYCLSKKERLELLNLAELFDFYIIEDDPWGEISLDSNPPKPIKHYDTNDRVIYIKGISKLFGAGYRLAALVACNPILSGLEKAKACADLGSALLPQKLLSEVLNSNMIDPLIKNIQAFLEKRMALTNFILKTKFKSKVKYTIPKGGYNIWIQLPTYISTEKLLFDKAYPLGITFLPGAICYPSESKHNELRISITYLCDSDYEKALNNLCDLILQALL